MCPYIKEDDRKPLDPFIEPLVNQLMLSGKDGDVNYVITKIVKGIYFGSYDRFNRGLGVLVGVLLEFYRRQVAPYEDAKREEHGEVFDS